MSIRRLKSASYVHANEFIDAINDVVIFFQWRVLTINSQNTLSICKDFMI